MNKLPFMPSDQYINDKTLKNLFNQYAGIPIQTMVAATFVRYPLAQFDYKQTNHIDFKEFNFDKKITFDEIYNELQMRNFIEELLNSQGILLDAQRKYRRKEYQVRMHNLLDKSIIYTRAYLKKLYGFGIYQLKGVRVQRRNEDNTIRTVASLSLVPTEARCIKDIKKYWTKDILPELKRRNTLATQTFKRIKRDMAAELEHQEEIQQELLAWEKEK